MAQAQYALVNENGTLVDIQMVESTKIATVQKWPKYFPVTRVNNRPTDYHSPNGESAALVDGAWVITPLWIAPASLDAVKASLRQQIDNHAEAIRLQFITPGAGQSMVYQRKAQEARDYLSAQSPNPADYPILNASVGIEGATITDVANMVVAKENIWAGIAAAIEAKRLAGKAAVSDAADAVAACAAFGAIDWALPQ